MNIRGIATAVCALPRNDMVFRQSAGATETGGAFQRVKKSSYYFYYYAKTPLRFRKGVLSVNQEGYQ